MIVLHYKHPLIWQELKIYCIYEYHSYWEYFNGERIRNNNFNAIDKLFLDLKKKYPTAINRFYEKLVSIMDNFDDLDTFEFTVVPSHDMTVKESPMHIITQKLSNNYQKKDYTQILQRFVTIPRLSIGGLRNIGIHINSIRVNEKFAIKGKNFILLDDIATTCSSLAASAQLLHSSGAKNIICLTLGYHKLD